MVRAESVLETGVCGARVDQKTVADLPDVPETLHGGRIECQEGGTVDADVVPERIANDFSRTDGWRGREEAGVGRIGIRTADGCRSRSCRTAPPGSCRLAHAGPAPATDAGTSALYCSKFSRNIAVNLVACRS